MKRWLSSLPVLLALGILLFGGLTTAPVAAQTSAAAWDAAFYNNEFLVDPPVYHANYNDINFDWGTGSPNEAVDNNRWSARFGTDVYFDAGTYRFTFTADDGVQFWVDYGRVLDTYGGSQAGQTVTVDVPLTAGTHHLQIDYREITDNAYLKMTWINVANIPTGPVSGNWTAQYYSNPNLSGVPFATLTEASPSHQFGLGAPLSGMPADNFSVRWSNTQNLPAGNYGIQVQADDGVRVFVNGIAYIDAWQLSSGSTYTANFSLPGGITTIVVEYFEAGYNAFINFNWYAPQGTVTNPSGATATVTAGVLNVRNAPSTTNTTILTKIRRNELYQVTGRNDASTWWRLNVNGVTGWVSGLFVNVANSSTVPVVDSTPTTTPPPTPAAYTVTTLTNLNLRAQATTDSDSLLVIPVGQTASVVGRNADASWLRVNYNGVVGWVVIQFVQVTPPLNLDQIPVS